MASRNTQNVLNREQRCTATVTDSKVRCKLSVIAQALAELREAVDPKVLAPYPDVFWPPPSGQGDRKGVARPLGRPCSAVTITPKKDPVRSFY